MDGTTVYEIFQSTLPVRGATAETAELAKAIEFQSTLPVRGATADLKNFNFNGLISIHAPREGSDGRPKKFQF